MTSLHLGCGLDYRSGALNVDRFDLSTADLQADALQLPLADASVAHIEARHLVEHLGHAGTVFALAEWFRVLEPGGSLLIVTPDRIAACLAAAEPTPVAPVIHWLFGLPWPGYSHRTLFDEDELCTLAEQARWSEVVCTRIEDRARVSDPLPSSLLLTARKPHDSLARLHARLHVAFADTEIIEPLAAPPHLAHLESVCENIVSAVEAFAPWNTRACLARVLGGTARYTPSLSLAALQVLISQGFASESEAAPFVSLVRALTKANLPARMAARLRQIPALPGTQRTRIAQLYDEVARYLTSLLHPGEDALAGARERFGTDEVEPNQTDLEIAFFCRETVAKLCQREIARGTRDFARGHLSPARHHLEAAIAYDADNPLSWWNLARLDLCEDRRLEALSSYAALLELSPSSAETIQDELDAATERSEVGLDMLLGPVQLHDSDGLLAQASAERPDR